MLAVVLSLSGSAVATKTPKIQLLEIGEFHGGEVNARTGEWWLGLFPEGNGYALRQSTISIERVFDLIIDEDEASGEKTGKKVTVNHESEPVFLIKGADMLRPGPVVTVFREEKNLVNGTMVNLKLNGKRYQLKVLSQDPERKDYLVQNTKLVLTMGGTSQTLISLKQHDDAGWSLFWAGDIDKDGKLDLYLDLSNHYNVSSRKLLLSSQAPKGKLVKELATFTTTGC